MARVFSPLEHLDYCLGMLYPLFDLDGTLIDSGPPIIGSANHALITFGFDPLEPHNANQVVGPPLEVSFAALTGEAPTSKMVRAMIDCYRADYPLRAPQETGIYDGVRDLLEALSGLTPMAVVTSKPKPIATPILSDMGLLGYFEFVEGPNLDGGETKPQTLKRALDRIDDIPPVMIGDRLYDIEAAVHHGIESIGVTWGYGDSDELTQAGASQIVDTPADLGTLLSRW